MSQHTPWFVNPAFTQWNNYGDHTTAPYAIVTATGEPVLSTSEWLHVEDADLQKMAAAPDLLAVADMVLATATCHTDPALVAAATEAIKKARGE